MSAADHRGRQTVGGGHLPQGVQPLRRLRQEDPRKALGAAQREQHHRPVGTGHGSRISGDLSGLFKPVMKWMSAVGNATEQRIDKNGSRLF